MSLIVGRNRSRLVNIWPTKQSNLMTVGPKWRIIGRIRSNVRGGERGRMKPPSVGPPGGPQQLIGKIWKMLGELGKIRVEIGEIIRETRES